MSSRALNRRGRRRVTLSSWALVWTSAALLAAGAALLGWLGSFPYAEWKPAVDALLPNRGGDRFNPEVYARFLVWTRGAAAAMAAALALLVWRRRSAAALAAQTIRDASRTLRRWRAELRALPTAEAYAVLALFCFGVLIRLPYLDQEIRIDEAHTFARYVSGSWLNLLTNYDDPNNHVLHSALAKLSITAFGLSLPAFRLPAFLAGILLPLAVWLWVRRVFGRGPAMLAMALTATNSMLGFLSTSARGYTMVTLAGVALLWLSSQLVERNSKFLWTAWTATAALGTYAMPIMPYSIGICGLWMLVSGWWKLRQPRPYFEFSARLAAAAMAATLLILLCYLPILALEGSESIVEGRWVRPIPGFNVLSERYFPRRILDGWTEGLPEPVFWCLIAAAGLGLLTASRTRQGEPSVLWFPLAMIPVLVIQRRLPYPRTFVFLSPFFHAASAVGLAWIYSRAAAWRGLRPQLSGATAMLACLFLATPLLVQQVLERNDQTGPARGIRDLTLALQSSAPPERCIAAPERYAAPMLYYTTLYRLPPPRFPSSPQMSCSELLFVTRPEEDIDFLLERYGIKLLPEPPGSKPQFELLWRSKYPQVWRYQGGLDLSRLRGYDPIAPRSLRWGNWRTAADMLRKSRKR